MGMAALKSSLFRMSSGPVAFSGSQIDKDLKIF